MSQDLRPSGESGASTPRPPHPVVYTVLIIPFGATNGFVTVALAFLATQRGLSVQQGASLIAASMFPNVWKFFWAPLGDKTLTRKVWYVISGVACAVTTAAMAIVPLSQKTLVLMNGIILVNSFAATFQGFSVEALVARNTPPADRGRTSGWFQAGNLGGTGVGGGLGLWLVTHMPSPWIAGVILGLLMLACGIPLLWMNDVRADVTHGTVVKAVKDVALDLWGVLRSTLGILCATLCFLPLGTGAAQGVLTQAEVAAHWGAGEHQVELVQGFLTGGVSMVGCLVGGWACSRFFNARVGYVIFGGMMACVTAAMAVNAPTVQAYVGYNIVYAFVTGLCYAAFSAFVLDAIGQGHAATKYNGFASLSNAPIWYMGLLLAYVEEHQGPERMLFTESALGVLGVAVFVALSYGLRGRDEASSEPLIPVAEPVPTDPV